MDFSIFMWLPPTQPHILWFPPIHIEIASQVRATYIYVYDCLPATYITYFESHFSQILLLPWGRLVLLRLQDYIANLLHTYVLYKLWRKKIYQKLTSIWYQLFVIVQKIQPFPETRFLGLNNVTADYYYFQFLFSNVFANFFPPRPAFWVEWWDSRLFMALRPLKPSTFILMYFYHSLFNDLSFCYIWSILSRLTGLEWCDKGLFMAPSHFSPISFNIFHQHFLLSYFSFSVFVFVNLNLSRLPHLTDVTVANGKWQCTFLTFCFFRESPWWWDSWQLNVQPDLKIKYINFLL